jgi:hypothetical protein
VVARCVWAAEVRRIRWNTAVAEAGSGERFCRPGGASNEGRGGETQRGFRGLNRRKRGKLLLSGSMGFNWGRRFTAGRCLRDFRTKVEEDWQPGPTCRRGEEGSGGYRFGRAGWAMGLFWSWAKRVPGVHFHIFFSLFFLFSYFFYIICKFDSNQAKPLSEIF